MRFEPRINGLGFFKRLIPWVLFDISSENGYNSLFLWIKITLFAKNINTLSTDP